VYDSGVRLVRALVLLSLAAGAAAFGCGAFGSGDEAEPQPAVEAGATDAASPGPETSSPALEADANFCAHVDAAFCADFDEGPVEQGWSLVNAVNGTVSLFPTAAMDAGSPPSSYRSRVLDQTNLFDASSDAAPPAGFAILSRDLLRAGKSKVAVDLDIHATSIAGGGAYMAILSVVFARAPQRYLSVVVNPSESALFVYDPALSLVSAPRLPLDWFHCRLEADVAAGTARLLYDGVEVAKKVSGGVISTEPGLTLDVGVYLNPAITDARVEYDNVVVTFPD
jgi:hypothetical protein